MTVLCLLAALGAGARADVLVVNPAGGGDFTSLNAAVAAASEGDTLLLQGPGFQGLAVFSGKSLTIVGDPAGAMLETVEVSNLQSGQLVVLRGLQIADSFGGAGVRLENNAGTIWIEDCQLQGGEGYSIFHGCTSGSNTPGGAGLQAVNCTSVTVERCQLTGGLGGQSQAFGSQYQMLTDGGVGADITGSLVAFHQSTLAGGQGGSNAILCTYVGNGGAGLRVHASQLLLSGCAVGGGAPGTGGVGGNGLELDATSLVQTLDGTITPGAGGTAVGNQGGMLQALPGTPRSIALASPLREQQAGTLHVQGLPGDVVGAFWSLGGGSLPLPGHAGWFVLATSPLFGPFAVGRITAVDGTLDLPFLAPDLAPAMEAETFLMQAYFQQPGSTTLGSGTGLVVVDAAF